MRRGFGNKFRDDRAVVEVVLDNYDSPTYDPLKAGSIDGTDVVPHDHAVARAMQSSYDASNDGKIAGDPLKTLFVSRLNHNTDEETLRGVFSKLGPVSHVRVVRDIVTGFSRGYGFVTFEHDSDFRRAWREAHRMYVDGVTILVEYERERVAKGWVPRRFGGGIGGKKESGQLRFGGRDRPFRRPLNVPATTAPNAVSIFDREHPETVSKMGVVMRVDSPEDGSVVLHVKQQAKAVHVSRLSEGKQERKS